MIIITTRVWDSRPKSIHIGCYMFHKKTKKRNQTQWTDDDEYLQNIQSREEQTLSSRPILRDWSFTEPGYRWLIPSQQLRWGEIVLISKCPIVLPYSGVDSCLHPPRLLHPSGVRPWGKHFCNISIWALILLGMPSSWERWSPQSVQVKG